MRRWFGMVLAGVLAVTAATPAIAEPDPSRPSPQTTEKPTAIELLFEMWALMRTLQEGVESGEIEMPRYGPPRLLPNGDILIPRIRPTPEVPRGDSDDEGGVPEDETTL